jgi:hypothetical protein
MERKGKGSRNGQNMIAERPRRDQKMIVNIGKKKRKKRNHYEKAGERP